MARNARATTHRLFGLLLSLGLVFTFVMPASGRGQARPAAPPDWAAVLGAEMSPLISVDSHCPPDPRFPAYGICVGISGAPVGTGSGYAALDAVTYGDIAGDGGTEAVIPLDSGGSIGTNGFLVYRLADAVPRLVAAEGGFGSPEIDNASGTIVVLTKLDGPTCCPTSMGRATYALVGDGLVQRSNCTYVPRQEDVRVAQGPCVSATAADQPAARTTTQTGGIVASLASSAELGVLKLFTGPVLLPAAGMQPFSSMPVQRIAVGSSVFNGIENAYIVIFGEQGMGTPTATVAGALSTRLAEGYENAEGCEPLAIYCTIRSPNDPSVTAGEIFRGVRARGANASVLHARVFGGEGWSMTWFDPAAGASYLLQESGQSAGDFGPPGVFSPDNRAGAERLAALADSLVVWGS